MARQVLPIVGAVVGAFFGSPQIGYAIGAVIGAAVDPVVNQGPKIGETGAQTSQEGAPRAIIYGTASCTGNIIAAGPVIKSTEIEDVDGGKGSEKSENEHAYRNYAIRICEGPIEAILRIWEDEKLVYDIRPGSLLLAESSKWISNKNVFLGEEDQLPSAFLNLNVPPLGDHPAHRGTAYIVFGLEDLTDRRGSIPQYRFEVSTGSTTILLEKVPSVSYGGSGTSLIDGVEIGGDNILPFEFVQPLILLRCDGPPVGSESYKAPIRVQAWVADTPGVIIADSGWLGDASNQGALDAALLAAGYSNLVGPIGGTHSEIEIDGLQPGRSIIWRRLACEIPGAGGNATTSQILFDVPSPGAVEEGWTYYGVPGVLLTVDGDAYAASWGPDLVNSPGGGKGLDEIVADIHTRCNMPASKYDVSELDDEVAGLVLAGDYTGADAISTLRTPYFFDKSEHSKKLHYPKRGAAVVATLTIDDLVEEPDLSKREQPLEFAKKMHLFYQHAASGYAAVKATSLRSSPDARVVGETSLQVPVVLNEDQAAQTVSKLHKVSWAEAEGEVTLSVPQSFIRLLPSNNIGLSLRGQAKRLRVEKREFAAGIINLTLRHDRQSAYTSNLTGVPIPPPTLPPSTIVGDTVLAILDIGSRLDTEDDLHYLAAGTGALPAWYGYALQRSLDGGASYSTVDRFGSSLMGSLLDAVPASSEHFTDTTNTVRVQLFRDGQTLEDLTELQFLSEQGAFALEKADGSWEVLQYRDADPEGAGVFALTTLHRGLLNSGASAHLAGARFVLLSRAEHIPAQSAWIGQPLTHRAASLGDSPELASPQTAVYLGRSQREWSVASLALSRAGDLVSGDIVPRHRFGTDDAPVASTNFTGFRVSIAGSSTVTFDTLAPSFSYDVSAIGGPVTVSVAALNRITGAGPVTTSTV